MILNTGSRTDIPAYYSQWFYNRIKEKYVLTRNPYYPQQVIKYRLTPDVVDVLVFCTKNPEPMLDRLDELFEFRQFWHVTITPYGKDIEPFVPDKQEVIKSLQRLSSIVGAKAVAWRYDPIFISDTYTVSFHIESFEVMAAQLKGYVNQCVISFIDLYDKTKRNFPVAKEVAVTEQERITEAFVKIGQRNGMIIRTCCENEALARFGAEVSGCLTHSVMEEAIGGQLSIPKGKGNTREGCDCLLGNDIGMYNSCGHGCLYCYANYDRKTVVENICLHDKNSPFLIGGHKEGDLLSESKQVSYFNGQMKLEF